MFRVVLKSTLAKKLRLFSTALSVLLGVAFLTGTLVFNATIRRTFDDLFADVFANTDSYIRSETSVDLGMGNEQRGRIPLSVVDDVRRVEGVSDVQGYVQGFAQLVDRDGDPIGNPGQGAPTLGMSYMSGPMNPWTFTEGSRVPGPDELVIDAASASKGGFAVGDMVTVLTQTGSHTLPLVGTVRYGSVDSPGGASIAMFDLATTQKLMLAGAAEVDTVMVKAVEGIDEETMTARLAGVLPDGIEALTGSAITEEVQNSIAEGLGFFNTFLLVFAVIGLVVASFTIYNTFQIIVTQRIQEMALLRSIGATRRQVLWAQLLEAVFVGVVASVVGVVAGVLVAGLLKAMLAAFGIDIPAGGLVFTSRIVIISLAVGIGVTVVSALFPSRRASRIPPLAAIRDVVVEQSGESRRRLLLGLTLTGLGIAGFVAGLGGSGLSWVGLGALLTLMGVFVLGPLIARPVVRVLGLPIARLTGVTGEMARENAMRNPKRTARTGGALMVGVALVAGITVIAASIKDWVRDTFEESFTGDFVVSTKTAGFGGLSPDLVERLAVLPEVGAATGVRMGAARDVDNADDTLYYAVDPASAEAVFDIGMIDGTVKALTTEGILVDDGKAKDRNWSVGDVVRFRFLNGVTRELTIQGIYTEDNLAGPFVIAQALHERTGTDQFDIAIYVAKADGVDDSAAQAAIRSVTDDYANAEPRSRREYIDTQAKQIDPLVSLIYALLALAVVIALINIANSMALSIHERTRELGLVRAVGMTRHQTRASITWEAVLLSLLGSGLGLLIGVFFGWAISVAIRDTGMGAFVLPVRPLIVIAIAAVLGGVLASLRPARRAARINVLRAIATA